MIIFKYILAWFPMVVIAIINGSLRQFTYGMYIDELYAHQISTITGITFFGIYIYFITKKWRLTSANQALLVGFIWLIMTVLFEFVFGHYVMGQSWEKLFHDYNMFAGRVWIFVLIWTTFSPYIFYRIHNR